MADGNPKSPEKSASVAESDNESVDEREEVLLFESDSEDDSDSERKPEPKERREVPAAVPAIDPRIDQSLSEIVQGQSHVKRYENKNSAKFVTGFDVTSKEARKKREDRAKRFGTSAKDKEEEEEDISSVLLPPGSKIGGHPIRSEALHVTGVDDMSTQDIFGYFQSYDPSSIEWINDTSCNIVWLDPHSAARALLGMSRPSEGYFKLGLKNLAQSRHLIDPDPIPEPDPDPEPTKDQEPEPMEEDEDDDTLDLVSDRETGEKVRPPAQRIIPITHTTSTTTTTHSNYASRTDGEEGMEGVQLGDEDLGPVDITYDEALRLGTPHPNADQLLIRYATKNDMKQKGAYKTSQYYVKYGNPNFGGMKGLLTGSMKTKIRQGKYVPGQARKRRYKEDSDEEREEEREEWPRKRRVPGHLERRLGEREPMRHQLPHRESPSPTRHRLSGSDRDESGEEDLEAEVRHALREDDDEGRDRTKMSRRMYADEIEDQIKKIRHTADTKPQQAPQQVVADARDRLRHGRARPNVRSRLGVGLAHSMTPAPSMENLKVILDVNERVSEHSWGSSGEEDEGETLVVQEDYDQEYDDDEGSVDGVDLMADIRSDLRSRLNRRQPSPAVMRPGFEPADSRPAFLQNLPSLQIEIREEI